MVGTERNINGW